MKISVIVCTRNRPEEIIRFSESLFSQVKIPNEYIIVDSSDNPLNNLDCFTAIKKLFPQVIYIHSNPGLTYQRNIGVKNASGDILFFFDDDIVLQKNYIAILLRVFEKDPHFMGGMGQIIQNPLSFKEKINNCLYRIFLLPNKFNSGTFYCSGFANMAHGSDRFLNVEVLSGGIAAYRKIVFQEFQFDLFFKDYGFMEDAEFSRNISKKYPLFYEPNAQCLHLHSSKSRNNSNELGKMIIRNYRYVFNKHFREYGIKAKIAHIWAIFGLFFMAFKSRNINMIRGYCYALFRMNIDE